MKRLSHILLLLALLILVPACRQANSQTTIVQTVDDPQQWTRDLPLPAPLRVSLRGEVISSGRVRMNFTTPHCLRIPPWAAAQSELNTISSYSELCTLKPRYS